MEKAPLIDYFITGSMLRPTKFNTFESNKIDKTYTTRTIFKVDLSR